MTPQEMQVFVDTILHGFTDTEIDCLENLSEWAANQEAEGNKVVLPEQLLMDAIKDYKGDENAGS